MVGSRWEHFDILWAVIVSFTIDMVDLFAFMKAATQCPLCNDPVLIRITAHIRQMVVHPYSHQYISMLCYNSPATPIRIH